MYFFVLWFWMNPFFVMLSHRTLSFKMDRQKPGWLNSVCRNRMERIRRRDYLPWRRLFWVCVSELCQHLKAKTRIPPSNAGSSSRLKSSSQDVESRVVCPLDGDFAASAGYVAEDLSRYFWTQDNNAMCGSPVAIKSYWYRTFCEGADNTNDLGVSEALYGKKRTFGCVSSPCFADQESLRSLGPNASFGKY